MTYILYCGNVKSQNIFWSYEGDWASIEDLIKDAEPDEDYVIYEYGEPQDEMKRVNNPFVEEQPGDFTDETIIAYWSQLLGE